MIIFHRLTRLLLVLVCVSALPGFGQTLTTSNLPIIKINTNGQTINDEPGIVTSLSIINNASGVNNVNDPANEYLGPAKVEYRGCSSQNFPKKPYGIELRSSANPTESVNVPLFGFPQESDWVLNASYTDKTFTRDPLTYYMANQSGRYASRVKYVELLINGVYQGVYIFQERIKRDPNRVNVRDLDPDDTSPNRVTGGYIVKVDKNCGDYDPELTWFSSFTSAGGTIPHQWATHFPNDGDITPQQFTYIKTYINEFETLMSSTTFCHATNGYPKYIIDDTFIDYFLTQEATSNADGFRISSFLSKQRDSDGGKLSAGPVWDFNLAYGFLTTPFDDNGQSYQGWRYSAPGDGNFPVPFWWGKLLSCCQYSEKLVARYRQLRQTVWQTETLLAFIDVQQALLSQGALARNFTKWPIIGVSVWNDQPSYVGATQPDEVNQLKTWITNRLAWMDANIESLSQRPTGTISSTSPAIEPNQTAQLQLTFTGTAPWSYTLSSGLSGSAASSPVTLTVQPGQTTTYTLLALSNGCGAGTVAGAAVVTVLAPTPVSDLSVTLESPRRVVNTGETVQVTLSLTNNGPETARQIQVQHRLPPQLTFMGSSLPAVSSNEGIILISVDSLEANQTALFTYGLRPDQNGTYQNAVHVLSMASRDPDSVPGSGTGDGQDDMAQLDFRTAAAGAGLFISPNPNQTPLPAVESNQPPVDPARADLALLITTSTLVPRLNQPVTLSLTVSNQGGRAASNVAVQTVLPTGWQVTNSSGLTVSGQTVTGTLPGIDAGSQATLTLTVLAGSNGTIQAQLLSASETDPDSQPGNGYHNGEDDEASLTLRVRP